jgi:2-C-methyl-D-erythritol 4-phosphate cytidylyltransferase/2-C-methyl-D-erythritol 2,4-cyclodiphosphate synthase
MKNLALIVAGGSGSRFGGALPKQYQMLGGKTVLQHSIDAFLNHPQIDGVLVVINKEHEPLFKANVPYCFGGNERQDSVRLGLVEALKYKPKNVLIHDAARPFVSAAVIDNVINALDGADAAIPVVPAKDSVRLDGIATAREKVALVQTPQGFDFKKILNAHQHFSSHWVKATDDAQVFELAGGTIAMVQGDEANIKITNQSDISRQAPDIRTGTGFDVHEFEVGTHVRICGIDIPHSHALKGHSDADVGLHAITDALLGAGGKGDIGEHFPPHDPRWKNADSAKFLQHAQQLVGGKINNIDVTIIAEEPKLTPYKPAMRKRIAEILGIDEARVNVKATTTEGLGFTGRREGIAAQAVVSIAI